MEKTASLDLVRATRETIGLRNRCDELAQRGTGAGTCNTPLDEHGNCPVASRHLDAS